MVTFATPFALVLALYFLPLNLKVTVFFFRYFLFTLASVACSISFLADFLTVAVFSVTMCFTVSVFVTVFPRDVIFSLYVPGVCVILKLAIPLEFVLIVLNALLFCFIATLTLFAVIPLFLYTVILYVVPAEYRTLALEAVIDGLVSTVMFAS